MNIAIKAEEYKNVDAVKKELKRLQSVKCRLQKQKSRSDYDVKMTAVLKEEQELKEVRSYLEPKKLTLTMMTEEQLQNLTFDETVKAIKSIQSKKCLNQYNDDKTEYNKALKIEEILKQHRDNIKPLEETVVAKSKIQDLINNIENLDNKIKKEYILEQLNNLL